MTIDKDDPRITAYALNELPAEEAAAVEEALGNDPALRAEVESIRATAAELQEALKAEALPAVQKTTPKAENAAAGRQAKRKPRRRTFRILFYASCGAAACLVCMAGLTTLTGSMRNNIFSDASDELRTPLFASRTDERIRTDEVRAFRVADMEEEIRQTEEKGDKYAAAPSDVRREKDLREREETIREKMNENRHQMMENIEKATVAQVSPRNPMRFPNDWKQRAAGADAKPAPGAANPNQPRDCDAITLKPGYVFGNNGVETPGQPSTEDEQKKVEDRWAADVKEAMKMPQELAVLPADLQKIKERAEAQKKEQFREQSEASNTEAYDKIVENEFLRVAEQPLSTFSIDVDTAGYSNLRRQLTAGTLPPPGSVRIEEMINYFNYDYAPPQDGTPFATHAALAQCPWNPEHTLLRVGLKGKVIAEEERPACNLVFLLDVSGSMNHANKLPLVREGMKLLVSRLNENDRVAIAVYAGASGLVLPSTPCSQKEKILDALDRLQAGGSTNGAEGIRLAYATAAGSFLEKGVNRVILCTDGDFNVGMTNQSDLTDLIEKKAKEKVFLTVLGFGMGNYKDSTLEKLADKGNGNYGYIDTINEAKKLLVDQLSGTLVTIAKDVKIQIEFNPAAVQAYRLIGYENRKLNKEDFNDDKKDAGEIGAGHTVTALYELVPAGAPLKLDTPQVDPLKYQHNAEKAGDTDEVLTLKLRYKEPDADVSKLLTFPVRNEVAAWEKADGDTRFAAAVAAFGMLLRGSQFAGNADFAKVLEWAAPTAKIQDRSGYRAEFVKLVRTAASLRNR